jgi:cobalt/nickel transport system permease protein
MKKLFLYYVTVILFFLPVNAYAMHIAEGFLPVKYSIFYFLLCIPFIYKGIKDIKKSTIKNKDIKMLLGLVAAFCFVLSALKLPSITGSSSHPTGTGFGTILFGPFVMSVISMIVLIFQAIFLAHGGLTTLGANTFSMGIVGPIVSFLVYNLYKNKNKKVSIFLAAMLGDLATYTVTAIQLALAFPSTQGGIMASLLKFLGVFSLTQIPLAIIEGIITVIIFDFIEKHAGAEMKVLEDIKL